jgi:hypothetical protein
VPERRSAACLTVALLAVGSALALFLAWRRWGPVPEHPVLAAAEVRQWSPTTCGPAVVATVLSAYGKGWTRDGLERECRLTAFGSSLEDLREALGQHGVRSRGYRALSARALLRVPRPFIADVGGAFPAGAAGSLGANFRQSAIAFSGRAIGARARVAVGADQLTRSHNLGESGRVTPARRDGFARETRKGCGPGPVQLRFCTPSVSLAGASLPSLVRMRRQGNHGVCPYEPFGASGVRGGRRLPSGLWGRCGCRAGSSCGRGRLRGRGRVCGTRCGCGGPGGCEPEGDRGGPGP